MASMQEAVESLSDKSIRHIVSISGGKDSTALALYLRQSFPEIPAEYVFCDTGCELPETYEYLERLEALLGVEVKRLNALDDLRVARKPGRNPFDLYLNELYGGFLPNPRSRWCTRVLKIQPFERFVGDSQAFSYIGIRGDEDKGRIPVKEAPGYFPAAEHPAGLPVQGRRDDPGGHQTDPDRIRDRDTGLLPLAVPLRVLLLLLPAGGGVAEPEGGPPRSLREGDRLRAG